ncbi:hypothetical protein RAS1_32640 [Phycisphaerae bacterium RAS1]|nr:hypothetical protein RAS1_32640 [Phycisphaerae bacterium RAS1]
MRYIIGTLAALTLSLGASTAFAANDCCWDWAPHQRGAEDQPSGAGPKIASETWAVCTQTHKSVCFQRRGRQMYWINWHCILGSQSPKGEQPPPNGGFACIRKSPPIIQIAQVISGDPQSPQPWLDGLIIEDLPPIPATTTEGMLVLTGLVVIAAVWILRRSGSTSA